MTISAKKLEANFVNYYMIIVILSYLARFFIDIRPALVFLMVNILLLILRIYTVVIGKARISLPLLFGCILLFSGVLSLIYSSSISVCFNSLIYVFTPMILCFSCNNENVDSDVFVFCTVVALIVCMVFGTLCFYLKPDFFLIYTKSFSDASYENLTHWAGVGRLVTLVGSIETGTLSAFLVIFSWGMINKKKKLVFGYIGLVVGIGCVLLTQQRGPLFSLLFLFSIAFIKGYKDKIIRMKYVIVVAVVVFAVFIYLAMYNPIVYEWMVERVTNPGSAITERYDYQWEAISGSFFYLNYFFGQGLGTFSQFCSGYVNHIAILDQMYFNMIGEIGFIGLIIFLLIIIKVCLKGTRNLKDNFLFLAVIISFCFTGLGTTLIYYPMITPIFWFCVGHILYSNNENNS